MTKTKTSFKKGKSGNSKGRPKGTLNKATLAAQTLLDGEAKALTRQVIELAKGGDMQALRLCLDRIVPPRKDRPVTLDLASLTDANDMALVSGAIVQAVAEGIITPAEGHAFDGLLDIHRKVIEHTEIEQRLRKLERKEQ